MNSAVYSLAMREHSRKEIYNKLIRKSYSEDVDITALIDELIQKDYLNETRFTESFLRYRSSRGQGSVKIKNDLTQRGITTELINQSFLKSDIDWIFIATKLYEKKYGNQKTSDFKEKAKQTRFLLGRGFDWEIIRRIV